MTSVCKSEGSPQTACGQSSMRSAGRRLLRAATVSIVALAVGPASAAVAAAPEVTITSPLDGKVTNNQTPTFRGTTNDPYEELPGNSLTLDIYDGPPVEGRPVGKPIQTPTTLSPEASWLLMPEKPLAEGTYTARAVQHDALTGIGESKLVTFMIDTTPPQLTIISPARGTTTSGNSQLFVGSAGTAPRDLPGVTVQLYSGSTISSQPSLAALTVQSSNGSWSATFGGLSPGTYTAQAEQGDQAGNIGRSDRMTFTLTPVAALPGGLPPTASFSWFPIAPSTDQSVSLVSTSTDATSPLTAFAWALTKNGAFLAGKPVVTTSFATPGAHIVRLRVTAADGRQSVASESILVTEPPLVLMQPFPIVRIAGTETSRGANISLLTVQAPLGARVTVSCHGRSCPTKSETRVAVSSRRRRAGSVQLPFRRFERSLRAGVILEIRVYKRREIGKYTRFVIRHGRLPLRVDTCLDPAASKPMVCPSS
jgi:hypothetical protein